MMDFRFLSWQEMGVEHLFHGTTMMALEGILRSDGIVRSPSFWSTERMAEYYAMHEGTPPDDVAVIRVPLARFDKRRLAPDRQSVAEPITGVLGEEDETLFAQWEACRGTWRDSLAIYESVVYKAPLRITEDDIMEGGAPAAPDDGWQDILDRGKVTFTPAGGRPIPMHGK